MLTISPGYTTVEIREFVHEYQLQPHGTKGAWLVHGDRDVLVEFAEKEP